MIEMTLAEVAAVTGGELLGGDGAATITGDVVIDSRRATTGSLFAALVGERTDGHHHIGSALEAGAVGALVSDRDAALRGAPADRLVAVPDVVTALADLARAVLARLRADHPVRVVAVTGSVGKTTTKDLLAELLAPLGELVAPPGSYNNEIGLPLTVLRAGPATATLVLEMGADHVGNIAHLTSIAPPDVAVVLRVGHAHLGVFGGIEQVARAKSELVTGLLPTGTAVLNADDPRVAAMAPLAPGPVLTYGRGDGAAVRATDVRADAAGHPAFTLRTGDADPVEVRLALVGEHHVTNALAAASVALHLGRTPAEVAADLATAGPRSPHRMHVVDRPDGIRVIDDAYNANPDSARAGLRALAGLAGDGQARRRTVAVLGAMLELGADSAAEHRALGAAAAELGIDVVLAVGAEAAPVAAASGGLAVEDLAAAQGWLEANLRPGDVVLLKGSNGTRVWQLADTLVGGGAG